MRISRIKYHRSKRIENGNIESMEATAEIQKGECPDMAFDDLKGYVKQSLDIRTQTTMSEAFKRATKPKEVTGE